jgi:large subunit ribosomal protein L2
MGIRHYKPTSPGRRAGSVSDFKDLTCRKKQPEKALIVRLPKPSGRNFHGRITARHRGGGHKYQYRIIDFKRDKDDIPGRVAFVEYDPNRTARIALINYVDGEKRYIIAPMNMKAGDVIYSGPKSEPKVGNCLPLSHIPPGTQIYNIEMQPGKGGQLCRSAGVLATLNARDKQWAQVTLPSGEVRRLPNDCRATIGQVSHADHQNISLGKAGRNRWKGIRPRVRGSAMNPIAHPMGGGEGRRSGGRHPCSPTGKPSKGGNTRKRRKPSSRAIVRRRVSRRNGPKKI